MVSTELTWQPLSILSDVFNQNLAALRSRDAELAARVADARPDDESQIFVAVEGNTVRLARGRRDQVEMIPNSLDAAAAGQVAAKLYASGKCTEPVLVAGLAQGWLWSTLFALPIHTPSAPGHRPPLYFLTADIERLWIAMHLHDWQALLVDPRVRLFVGADAIAQGQRSMSENLAVQMPRLSVTIEPKLWGESQSIDTLTAAALATADARMSELKSRHALRTTGAEMDSPFESNRPLRVMGITSRYSTFLQYSMRDWLEAFDAMGHSTKLMIEPNDAALHNPIAFAEACNSFEPDLIVMIDHYRAELSGIPQDVPFVMWIQDELPNIFNARAGAAQTRHDYAIGYGRVPCVYDHGYPSDRFRPVMIGTNERRFQPRRLTHEERDAHTCDVSFVSHCSTPAEQMVREEVQKYPLEAARQCIWSIFEQLRAEYDAGRTVTMMSDFRQMIDTALRERRLEVDDSSNLLNLFTHRINNALFRHQSLRWLNEMGVRLNLYGRGWEQNSEFSKHARGIADNTNALSAIYQASRINLQVSPFGSAHQRVFDGLAAGGFFLLRHCPGDRSDRILRDIWEWCAARRITNIAQLRERADETVQAWVAEVSQINGVDAYTERFDFVHELAYSAEAGFTRNSATLFDEYDAVSYDSRAQLQQRVAHYLTNDAERAVVTRSMRQRVLETMTYRSIAAQTIDLVQRDTVLSAMKRAA